MAYAIRLAPAAPEAKIILAQALSVWSRAPDGRTDPRLEYRTCCEEAHWAIPPALLEEYGPLPFKARRRDITARLRWREHPLKIHVSDLPATN